jgi:hypothetical protein
LTESQSIDGSKCGRPICVILDEIDGTVGSEGQVHILKLVFFTSNTLAAESKKSPPEQSPKVYSHSTRRLVRKHPFCILNVLCREQLGSC